MVGQDVSLLAEIKDIEGTKDDPLETSSSASVQGDFDNQAELPVWGMALIGTLTAGVVRNAFTNRNFIVCKALLKSTEIASPLLSQSK